MLVLCKNKKPEDLLKYGFKEKYDRGNEIYMYELKTKRKKNGKFGKKGDEITLLSYQLRNNLFDWDRTFYNEEMQKIVYILIKDNIIEYEEPYDKQERIAKLEAKIQEYKNKIKELEEENKNF